MNAYKTNFNTLKQHTSHNHNVDNVEYVFIDATKYKSLGRMCTEISMILSGKRDVQYSPHINRKRIVSIYNTASFAIKDKECYYHTGYMGGRKSNSFLDIWHKNPRTAVQIALKNMISRNKTRRSLLSSVHVFENSVTKFDQYRKTK